MTLETWKKEFYPTKPSNRMSKKAAIKHSLRKWEGLRESNLKKHGCFAWSGDVGFQNEDETYEWFIVDADNCSLCIKYLDYNTDYDLHCEKCPLAQHLGSPCDRTDSSPYMIWSHENNPLPMIKALKKIAEEA